MKLLLIITLISTLIGSAAQAQMLVEKKRFSLPSFTTFGGETIQDVQVGWESYGELNEAKDNVILITHYFTGNSHAAGKYHPDDPAPGYWDAIIGPGKAIDTEQFYVISVDSLANISAHDPNVITTGPASTNPATGRPYGLDFPVVTIRDFVNVQKALLESLGIKKLHAVVGPSMGSMQAIDWASAYPDWVERMVSVIGTAQTDAWGTAALEQWAMPIRLDPNWHDGDYYDKTPPLQGLTQALMMVTQIALHPAYFKQVGQQADVDYAPLETGPLKDIRTRHSIVQWLEARAAARANSMDANHLLYLVRACQLFIAGHGTSLQAGLERIKADTLFLPASTDLLLMPYLAKDAHQKLLDTGNKSQLALLEGSLGHLEGVAGLSQQAQTLKTFLTAGTQQGQHHEE